jgi:transcriptional regulator with XRE-family HTH domain
LLARQVGARVTAFRLAAGLSMAELAERSGTHRPIVGRVERGVHLPDWWTLAELARGLGVSMGELLAGVDWPQVDKLARANLRGVA